jgi:flagellar protein FlaG
MSIAEIQVAGSAKVASDFPEHGSTEQAAKNREIARAVKILNDGGGVGAGSEVRFAIDGTSGQALIRIVDRVTEEVIRQIPSESVIRMAEVLQSLGPGERLA